MNHFSRLCWAEKQLLIGGVGKIYIGGKGKKLN